ncbi:hypothetical protein I3760_14G109800 [Carya illinoinensis]|nr:hypothetical protein I3760_14G109800 [Carya illinoinensis]
MIMIMTAVEERKMEFGSLPLKKCWTFDDNNFKKFLNTLSPKKRWRPFECNNFSAANVNNYLHAEGREEESRKPKRKRKKMNYNQRTLDPPVPDMPAQLMNKIVMELHGCDIKLVIQKVLIPTDLDEYQARLSLPNGKIKVEFLTQEERDTLGERKADGVHCIGLELPLIEPSLAVSNINMRKWKLGKTDAYILSSPWIELVAANGLRVNSCIQLWSFRVEKRLHLALVKLLDN